MTIEQIKEEIKEIRLKRERSQERLDRKIRAYDDYIYSLEKKMSEIAPREGMFAFCVCEHKNSFIWMDYVIVYKEKGAFWIDFIKTDRQFARIEHSERKRTKYHSGYLDVIDRVNWDCRGSIEWGDHEYKLAPYYLMEMEADSQFGNRLFGRYKENLPDLRYCISHSFRSEEQISEREYSDLLELHNKRQKQNACVLTLSEKAPNIKQKRERIRLRQMGFQMASYYLKSDVRNAKKLPTDKSIVELYNKNKGLEDNWMAGRWWSQMEKLTEEYFARAGINPKTFNAKKAKESVVKSTARHLAKKLKKVKQLTTHELDFFKMMHGASLIKKLTEKGITV